MDLSLTDEEREIRDWVRTFVTREIMPLEPTVLERERRNERGLTRAELRELQDKAKQSGFFGLQTPEEYGGMALGAVMSALIEVELGRSFVPFRFGGEADNILYSANDEQQQRYLLPTISGEKISCFAITEPGAGSDARNIRTAAVRDGDEWVINGEKTFITFGDVADFVMVFAVTDKEMGANGGVTCFLVDREAGWTSAEIPTMGQWGPASLSFQDVRVPHSAILGEEGRGFELAMKWIGKGRYMLPARALGACERLVEMGMEHARNRVTFGEPIANRQAIQWMVADSAVEIEALRWLVLTAAWQVDHEHRLAAVAVDGQALRRHQGQRDRRPGPADARRHGLHPRASGRAVVPRAEAAADLRGDRRDPAPHDRAQPALRPRVGARAPGLTCL